MKEYILSIDQGTTSTRAIIFDAQGKVIDIAQQELQNTFQHPGWVEQDANEIWLSVLSVLSLLFINSKIKPEQINSIGITNQRETTVVWNKETGIPVYKAIVWQSRQSSEICERLQDDGYEDIIKEKTGLPLDAYFSASKIKWLFENDESLYQEAQDGKLLFGTIDTWLVWNLSKTKRHISDYSNASRTMLYNIYDLKWDEELLEIFDIPSNMLPEVCCSSHIYDYTNPSHFFGLEVPIAGIAGDQQAALFGQICHEEGTMKNTYGTGCFMLLNTGKSAIKSKTGLVTTIAWGINNEINYALEGSIFVAGSAVQWLRDSLEIINDAKQSQDYAFNVSDNGGVYLVPAFVGLGSPHWDSDAKAAIFGLTRGSNKYHITRATLESIGYQTKDIVEVMKKESKIELRQLKVDGGATNNKFLMQFQSDILDIPIEVPANNETTALGVAYLAGLATGFYKSSDDFKKCSQNLKEYQPNMSNKVRDELYSNWQKAVKATQMFK
ncbi:MAG: glycerol kinase GlpK [Erysipelotrichales bacterium]